MLTYSAAYVHTTPIIGNFSYTDTWNSLRSLMDRLTLTGIRCNSFTLITAN